MKKILQIALILICANNFAQVKGNKEITEQRFETESIEDIEISIYGDITIDVAASNGISISTDSNLFKHIDTEVVDGKLKLDQKKWIQPSQRPRIIIGAPDLNRVQMRFWH